MLNINPKKFAELKGHHNFGFNVSQKTRLLTRFAHTEFNHLIAQFAEAGKARGYVEALRVVPCEANIRIGIRKGCPFLVGDINVPGEKSLKEAEQIITTLSEFLALFAKIYPLSSFSIKATQQVKFVVPDPDE